MFLRSLTILILVAAFGMSAVLASTKTDEERQTTEDILTFIAELRDGLEDGDPRALSRREWQEFNRIENRFQRLLTGVDDVHALHHDRKIEVSNLQEELGELLIDGNRDNRIVCTRHTRTGSRIPRRDCTTQGELDRERQRTRTALDGLGGQFGGARSGAEDP